MMGRGRRGKQEDRQTRQSVRSGKGEPMGKRLVEILLRHDPGRLLEILEASMEADD